MLFERRQWFQSLLLSSKGILWFLVFNCKTVLSLLGKTSLTTCGSGRSGCCGDPAELDIPHRLNYKNVSEGGTRQHL